MSAIVRRIQNIEELSGIRPTDLADMLNTNIETVSRWRNGRNAPQANNERAILDIEYIIEQLREFYGRDEARHWLYQRQRALRGRMPAELIRDGDMSEVLRLVHDLGELNYS